MPNIHDRVTFIKDGTTITGKIIDIYYNLEREVMVTIRTDTGKHHILKMVELEEK